MRSQSQVYAKGDEVDKEISRVLGEFCEHDLTRRSFSDFKTGSKSPSSGDVQGKYKDALEIELATYLPIVKLSPGKYLIGAHER